MIPGIVDGDDFAKAVFAFVTEFNSVALVEQSQRRATDGFLVAAFNTKSPILNGPLKIRAKFVKHLTNNLQLIGDAVELRRKRMRRFCR